MAFTLQELEESKKSVKKKQVAPSEGLKDLLKGGKQRMSEELPPSMMLSKGEPAVATSQEPPKLIKKSLNRDTKKVSKSLDKLQEGLTGEKTTKSNKMSESMKMALVGGLPLLIGGLFGGEDGLQAGAKASMVGVKELQRGQAAEGAAKQEADELQAQKDIEGEKVAVDREKIASQERIANLRMQAKAKASANAGAKPLTESQSKSRIFGSRAAQAEEEFTSLLGGTFDPTSRFSAAGSFLPENMQTSERQQFEQAKTNYLTAVLRKESGARISEEELEVGDSQYFPKAGDGDGVVAQKARNRKLVTDLLLEEGQVDLKNPKIQRNFTKTTRLQQIQAIKQRRGL